MPIMKQTKCLILLAGLSLPGCYRISINPQCPDTLEEGQNGALVANEDNTGAIADYLWEAGPALRVTIENENRADTTFVAERSGTVIFTLTASDGLFQMIDTCTTLIVPPDDGEPEPEPGVSVNLVANPTTIALGSGEASALLTCTNTGTTSATLTIDQLDGPPAQLTSAVPGISVAEFPQTAGTYVFRCIGTDADGNRSDPSVARVTLQSRSGPR